MFWEDRGDSGVYLYQQKLDFQTVLPCILRGSGWQWRVSVPTEALDLQTTSPRPLCVALCSQRIKVTAASVPAERCSWPWSSDKWLSYIWRRMALEIISSLTGFHHTSLASVCFVVESFTAQGQDHCLDSCPSPTPLVCDWVGMGYGLLHRLMMKGSCLYAEQNLMWPCIRKPGLLVTFAEMRFSKTDISRQRAEQNAGNGILHYLKQVWFYLAFINLIWARIEQENLNILHINYPMGTVQNCNSRPVPGFLMQGHDC